MNGFEKKLSKKIHLELPDLEAYTPSLALSVIHKGRQKALLSFGKTYDYYDLASLTKIIFSASNAIDFFSYNPKELNEPIRRWVDWWNAQTTPFQLLTHTAGLSWWKPYYKMLSGPMDPIMRWDQLKLHLALERPGRRKKALYSDLDLWLLGAYLESARGESLLEMWDRVRDQLVLHDIFFHPKNVRRYKKAQYAPTENCPWRGRVIQGEVHDENTWALGGVAPHAGLFGSIESVSDWALKLRNVIVNDSGLFGDPRMAQRFVRRQIPRVIGDWGLGFMKPSVPKSSCGKHFSLRSFGHTGFTGTSIWIDPVQDLIVVLLSNRVHPTRDNARFVQLRAPLHDWICEMLL